MFNQLVEHKVRRSAHVVNRLVEHGGGTSASVGPHPGGRTLRDVIVDEGLELLSEEEARALLGAVGVGRVGVTIGALPAIFPVNHSVVDGAIVFHAAPGSELSAAVEGRTVAFEVDELDPAERTGWSVLAVGQVEVVDDLLRIVPTFVSGRRIVHQDGAPPRPSRDDQRRQQLEHLLG